MLHQLRIQNYILIRNLEVEFRDQLNTITGETGAGKSILLGALGLILGNRADGSSLLNPEKKCVLEGSFDIRNYNLKSFFEKNELDWDENTLLRREIAPNGKSRAFINDTPVNLNLMKELGEKLVDIHSQHQTIKLTSPGFQTGLLDAFASHKNLLDSYITQLKQYRRKNNELNKLKEEAARAKKDYDYNQFQLNELVKANLQQDELEKLEEELTLLSNAENIQASLQEVTFILYEDELSITNRLRDVKKQLSGISNINPALKELSARVESLIIEIKDIYSESQNFADSVAVENARMELVGNRIQVINQLLTKHQFRDVIELLRLKDELSSKVSTAENITDLILDAEKAVESSRTELDKIADQISKNRKEVIPSLEEKLVSLLRQVGIAEARIQIRMEPLDNFGDFGKDRIDILFSANKGMAPDLVSNAASGGELSRLMLCFKYILADTVFLPTIILDEIDTGISGEVSIRVGQMIRQMSADHQVICITHQPQIAAMGQHHYQVFKRHDEDITQTHIRELEQEERVDEIAKMLSGHKPSMLAIESARELLAVAE